MPLTVGVSCLAPTVLTHVGAFLLAGGRTGAAIRGDVGFSFGAFSWTGIGVVGGGDGDFFLWTGTGVVGGGDDGFLFEVFPCLVGRAPIFWKYKLQVGDSSMR